VGGERPLTTHELARAEQASGVDITDAGLRWAWVMRDGDEIALEGMDFAELAPDGRIQRIAGLLGPLPPLVD
jgi:hypothetical protein